MNAVFSESAEHIDVNYVAHLARLELNAEEQRQYQEQLDSILNYAKKLQELDVDGVEPMAHPLPVNNVFRKDDAREGLPRDVVLANAPEQRNGQFVVPKIIE